MGLGTVWIRCFHIDAIRRFFFYAFPVDFYVFGFEIIYIFSVDFLKIYGKSVEKKAGKMAIISSFRVFSFD